MARYNDNTIVQLQALKDQRERDDRAAVASGNVDENSALYRHAKLNGWDLGDRDELHGPARANAVARDRAATEAAERQAAGPIQSPISSFAADMDTGYFASSDPDSQLRAGFDGILANVNAAKADRARRGRTVLGSMVGKAMDNGGMVPKELGAAYGRELGTNGPAFGTLAKDGTFISLGMGQDGKMQPTGMVDPFGVLGAMVQSGDWEGAGKFERRYLRGKYTPQQIAQTGYTDKWFSQMRNKSISDASAAEKMKFLGEAQKVLAELDKGGRQATLEDFIRALPKEVISGMSRGELETDPEGNPVLDGENNPVYKQVTPAEIGQRLREIYDGSRGGGPQDDDGGELRNAILGAVRGMFAPQPVDPRDAAMYDRSKQQEYIRSNPQSAFEIKGANGRSRYMNGWLVDGRLYDGRGNDITDSLADGESVSDLTSGATYDFSAPAQPQRQTSAAQSDIPAYDPAMDDKYKPGDRFTNEGAVWEVGPDGRAHFISRIGDARQPQAASAAAPQAATVQTTTPPTGASGNSADRAPALAPAAELAAMAQPPRQSAPSAASVTNAADRRRLETPLRDTPLADIPSSVVTKAAYAVKDAERRAARTTLDYAKEKAKPIIEQGRRIKNAVEELPTLSASQIQERVRRRNEAKRQRRNDEEGRRMDLEGKLENERRQREGEAAEREHEKQKKALSLLREFSKEVGVEDPADFIRDPEGMMTRYDIDMDDNIRAAIRTLEVAPASIWE